MRKFAMSTSISMRKELLETLLESSKALHPKETILLLRGKANRATISVSEILIPPLAMHGKGFSSFPTHMLPIDFSIIGVAHSHPSGNLQPSVGDLNHPFGKMTIIMASPYKGGENVAAYDRDGKRLTMQIT